MWSCKDRVASKENSEWNDFEYRFLGKKTFVYWIVKTRGPNLYVRWWLTTGKGKNSNMEESTTDLQPTDEGFLKKLRMGSSFFKSISKNNGFSPNFDLIVHPNKE